MKFILIFIFILTMLNQAYSQVNEIIIKIEPQSIEYQRILNQENVFSDFIKAENIISMKPAISPKLILALSKKKMMPLSSMNVPKLNELSLYFKLTLRSNNDAEILAKKIGKLSFVQNAETIPQHRFIEFEIPNDPEITRQYYLESINAFEAWSQFQSNDTAIVAIVDTGIDLEHEDLKDNLFYNSGEMGFDENGNDKRFNGLDDDGNGFIDDYVGWDFVASNFSGQDNMPTPGNSHGTHVAGIVAAVHNNSIGIAGVGRNIKLLPVKIGSDNPNDLTVRNQFDGVLYGALMQASVINCSWGSSSFSFLEQEIVDYITSEGVMIIGAAGNDGRITAFYPASYKNALSVAAVGENNVKTGFSNFHSTVDISAPGNGIISTVPSNAYQRLSGTSMAAPIVSAIAAMAKLLKPDYAPKQIFSLLKATSTNLDSLQFETRKGRIGNGKINMAKALSDTIVKFVEIIDYELSTPFENSIIQPGDKINLNLKIENTLAECENVVLSLSGSEPYPPIFSTSQIEIGQMLQNQQIEINDRIKITIPNSIPKDQQISIRINVDADGFRSSQLIAFNVNPSFRTLNHNKIAASFNSRGNIAYNDYPSNTQGDGWNYDKMKDILFEGALMIAAADGRVSNVARGSFSRMQDYSLFPSEYITIDSSNSEYSVAKFTIKDYLNASNVNADSNSIGVFVKANIYQFKEAQYQDFMICQYEIQNKSDIWLDSLYLGLFLDWDIPPVLDKNIAYWNEEYQIGIAENNSDTLPLFTGISLLSDLPVNFYAMDNDGITSDNIGIYNGFTKEEKLETLSNSIARKVSSQTDVSVVIGGGKFALAPNQSRQVSFAISNAYSLDSLIDINKKAKEAAMFYDIDSDRRSIPKDKSWTSLFPNPFYEKELYVEFILREDSQISMEIVDLQGKIITQLKKNENYKRGYHKYQIDGESLSQGIYFLKIQKNNEILDVLKFIRTN